MIVVDADAIEANDTVPAVDHFLRNTPISLEHLWLQIPRQNELPTLAHIARHGITLKTLHLDCSNTRAGESQPSSAHYNIDVLRKYLPRFANITQLGLSLQPFLNAKFTREDGIYLVSYLHLADLEPCRLHFRMFFSCRRALLIEIRVSCCHVDELLGPNPGEDQSRNTRDTNKPFRYS